MHLLILKAVNTELNIERFTSAVGISLLTIDCSVNFAPGVYIVAWRTRLSEQNLDSLFQCKRMDLFAVLPAVKRIPVLHSLQSNFNSSNTDGSFTMANSNLFLSPYEIPWIDQENNS